MSVFKNYRPQSLSTRISLLLLLGSAFLLSCGEPTQTTNDSLPEENTSTVVIIPVSEFTDSNGEFQGATTTQDLKMLGSTEKDQWLQFDIDIPVAGRYKTEVIGNATSEGSSVWVEDHVDNPDGRTYNVTGVMPVQAKTDLAEVSITSRDGSPFNIGKHKVKLHFSDPAIYVQEVKLTLLSEHVVSPQIMTQEMSGSDWQVVWSDEFEVPGLPDSTKWTFDVGDWGWGNNELQYYTAFDEKNARVENGNLVIEAHKGKTEDSWTSARLTTRGKTTFKYGKIEFRAKVPTARGNWAAGWTLGEAYVDELSWPYCGEIDIMESVGYEMNDTTGDGKAHASVHCRAFYFKEGNHYTSTLEMENMNDAFHTYGVIWAPEGITAYVDDQEYFTYSDTTDSRTWPFSEPQNIILNLAMGGGWGGAQGMDATVRSQAIVVDYVRVYARK